MVFKKILRLLFNFLTLVLQFLFPSRLELVRVQIPSHTLRKNLNRKIKIVQLSDFHVDRFWPDKISTKLLQKAVDLANKENPDLILLTGDYVDKDTEAVHQIVPFLKQLNAKYGVFACLGNHDYKESYEGRTKVLRTLESCNIRVLVNGVARPFPESKDFEIVGVGDVVSNVDFKPQVAFAHAKHPSEEGNVTRILLSHNPDTSSNFNSWKVDLHLAGHAHGGQICLPFTGKPVLRYLRAIYNAIPQNMKGLKKLFPIHVVAIDNWDYVAGLHSIKRLDGGDNLMYVSRGLGTHPPCRINCPCEVNVLELIPV